MLWYRKMAIFQRWASQGASFKFLWCMDLHHPVHFINIELNLSDLLIPILFPLPHFLQKKTSLTYIKKLTTSKSSQHITNL